MAEPYRTQRLVEFSDTDMAGIMHFAAFFRYMESAEHELLRHVGLSVHAQIDGQTISFPRVASTCRFTSPARCEEVLDVAVSLKRIGGKSLTYRFQFSHLDRGVAEGEMTCVCCRVEPGEPLQSIPLPEDLVTRLSPYAE